MPDLPPNLRYRFGVFEADSSTGELRRKGLRVKLHSQPFQLLVLLLERPGEMLTREEIRRELWPDGTFVDYEHGVNSALNRLRHALGDRADNPRFIETLARRGYRFVAPVELIAEMESNPPENNATASDSEATAGSAVAPVLSTSKVSTPSPGFLDRVLASPEDLPRSSPSVVRTLFLLLQLMYLGFYVGALANLAEINELISPLPYATQTFLAIVISAALLILVRTFLLCAVLFHAPGMQQKFLKIWPFLLPFDEFWSLAPFLLLHHIPYGLGLACMAPLVYSPFAQRSLILMGAASSENPTG